jgi:hypothetical protein
LAIHPGRWFFCFCQVVEHVLGGGSVAVSVADLAGGDDAVLGDEEFLTLSSGDSDWVLLVRTDTASL